MHLKSESKPYHSDTGYMKTSGPCPIFEGLVLFCFFKTLRCVVLMDRFLSRITSEIGSKYGPFDIAMLPIWRGGTLSFIARLGFRVSVSSPFPNNSQEKNQILTNPNLRRNPYSPHIPAAGEQLIHTPDSLLTSFHATPSQAVRMHGALRSRHSLAMHFATFAGSDVEAFDPIVELERAKREIDGLEGEETQAVGDWWMEGGMGVIDVGETAVVRVGDTLSEVPRCAVEQ
jgi:N-acyl-phosphatidylethanolamine-hydrolysing phospholipase D